MACSLAASKRVEKVSFSMEGAIRRFQLSRTASSTARAQGFLAVTTRRQMRPTARSSGSWMAAFSSPSFTPRLIASTRWEAMRPTASEKSAYMA